MSAEAHRREAAAVVGVHIYNQLFNLRSERDGEYVRQVAGLVDARMREISPLLPSGDVFKIAVLAALNIADELCRLQAAQAAPHAAPPAATASEPAQELRREPEAAPSAAPSESADGLKAWSYEDIFEFGPGRRKSGERMTEQVASRLRSLRQSDGAGPLIVPEAENG